MAFWDKFKKRSQKDPEQDVPMLAGIPAPPYQPEAGIVGPNPDAEDPFVSPVPYNQPDGWISSFPLVFFLMENNVCTKKIDFTCYGNEYPDDIIRRMIWEHQLPENNGFAYRILYWPTRNGMSTVEHFDTSAPMMLMNFNPEPGKVFIIEQYRKLEEPEPMYTLYGCPTAALPAQENALTNPCVDTVSYD